MMMIMVMSNSNNNNNNFNSLDDCVFQSVRKEL